MRKTKNCLVAAVCDVCPLFVLPVGWVFGFCHLFLVLCQECVDNRIFGNGVVVVRTGCICRTLCTKRDGRTLLYIVTAAAVAVSIASNDLCTYYVKMVLFTFFSCAFLHRAQLPFDRHASTVRRARNDVMQLN